MAITTALGRFTWKTKGNIIFMFWSICASLHNGWFSYWHWNNWARIKTPKCCKHGHELHLQVENTHWHRLYAFPPKYLNFSHQFCTIISQWSWTAWPKLHEDVQINIVVGQNNTMNTWEWRWLIQKTNHLSSSNSTFRIWQLWSKCFIHLYRSWSIALETLTGQDILSIKLS